MVEDLPRHRRLSDEGDEAQPASALVAGQHIDVEDLLEKGGPGNAVGPQDERLTVSGLRCHPRGRPRLAGCGSCRECFLGRRRRRLLDRIGNDAAAQPRMRREHAVIAQSVNPRRRDERGKLGEEFLGREREPQRSMARPLRPVEQAATLAAGEAVHGERRAQDVTAEPLAAVAIARVDPDARVEREPLEGGAAPPPLERLGMAQAPLHLGGFPLHSANCLSRRSPRLTG